jgi:hypothetical protein
VAPSWFDRLNQPAADTAARTATNRAKAEPATAEPQQAAPAKADDSEPIATSATAAVIADVDTDDDDDWPTRYSWLEDDETDEAAKVADATTAAKVADATVAAKVADATEAEPAEATPAEPAAEAAPPDAKSPAADVEDHAATADDAKPTTDSTDETAEPGGTRAVDEAREDESSDEPSANRRTGAKLVTVIPGVPRYHDPDCILIRFMDEDDIARKSIPEAKAANCTPCAACQPEG